MITHDTHADNALSPFALLYAMLNSVIDNVLNIMVQL